MITKNAGTRDTFTANLATFTITFRTFEADSIDVYVIELATGTETALTKDTHYTLSNLGVNGQDGSISLIAGAFAWLDGSNNLDNASYSLVVEHSVNTFQPGYFRNLSTNTVITLEQVLDRMAMAVKSSYREIEDFASQLTDIIADIASNAADIITNAADIAANLARIIILEDMVLSKKQTLADNTTAAVTLATIDETVNNDMVFEYVIKRGGGIQYGRVLISNDSPFAPYVLEKVGNVGVSFTVNEVGGVGTVQYTTTPTGSTATIRYKLSKFAL